MARIASALILALVATATAVSPVQKVIQLIEDMEGKVSAEGKAASEDFEQYAKWCDDEAGERERSIKEAQGEIADLQATIDDSSATIATLETKISDTTSAIASTEKELSTAKANRQQGHKTFMGAEDELVDTVSTLDHDADLMKKEMGSFLQSGRQIPEQTQEKFRRILGGLKSISEAAFVSTHHKREVEAFLQQKSQADDEDMAMSMQQPAAYESKSGGIIETIEGMGTEADDNLQGERKEETGDQGEFMLLKMSLENEIKNLKDELSSATGNKQQSAMELAAAKKGIASTKKGLGEDQSYLKDLKGDCQAKAGEYEEEYKDRTNELTALGKAKAIMTEKFSSFIQTSARTHVRSHMRSHMEVQDEDRKDRALKLIQRLGKSLHSTALVALSYRALADPFGKVKKMISEMIEKLVQEAAEEADGKAFCDKEQGESRAAKADKEEKLNTVDSRMESSTAAVEKLQEELKMLSGDVAQIDKAMAEATGIRNNEKVVYDKASKDYAESQEACAAAIEVLRSYYESGSFVQLKVTTRTTSKAKASAREGDAGGIIGMLEVAESDFSKLLSEVKASETMAVEEFEKMVAENKILKATKLAEEKGKKSELASLSTRLEEYGDDKAGLDTELAAVVQYLDKLKPQCEYQVPSYEERKQRRNKEIDGLKEALSVLEGDGIA